MPLDALAPEPTGGVEDVGVWKDCLVGVDAWSRDADGRPGGDGVGLGAGLGELRKGIDEGFRGFAAKAGGDAKGEAVAFFDDGG